MNEARMHLFSLFALVVLAGCAHRPIDVHEVQVPVAVRCKVSYPRRLASCFQALPAKTPVFESVKCLLVDREQSLAYEGELLAALKACAEPL